MATTVVARRDRRDTGTTRVMRPGEITQIIEQSAGDEQLLRIAHMFSPYRENTLMRGLCRLAVKCAQDKCVRKGSVRV